MKNRVDNGMRTCVEKQRPLMNKLLSYSELYFANGYLNSEGLRLITLIARIIAKYCPEYLNYVKRARKTKSYEDFLKLATIFEESHIDS